MRCSGGCSQLCSAFFPTLVPWIAAAFPIVLSVAVSNTWTTFALTVGLFVVYRIDQQQRC
jgi:hypothetical protein